MKRLALAGLFLLGLLLIAIIILPYTPVVLSDTLKNFIVSQESILALLFEEETVFADKYTSKAWKTVRIGDNMDSVLTKLGTPLAQDKSSNGNKECLNYSKQGPKNTNYRIRIICFDSNQKVEKIIQEYYLD